MDATRSPARAAQARLFGRSLPILPGNRDTSPTGWCRLEPRCAAGRPLPRRGLPLRLDPGLLHLAPDLDYLKPWRCTTYHSPRHHSAPQYACDGQALNEACTGKAP